MREEVRDLGRIRHMIESINNVFSFMDNKTVQDLEKDKMLFYAVVKNIEINVYTEDLPLLLGQLESYLNEDSYPSN